MDKTTYQQLDRIEAKLNALLELESIKLDRFGYPEMTNEEDYKEEDMELEKTRVKKKESDED